MLISCSNRSRLWLLWTALAALGLVPWAARADSRTGEQIYRQRCASCHGPSGEGTDENYPHRLEGKKTLPQLVRFISRSMPKDDPKKCAGEEADKVAAYIYAGFYSEAARARLKPPRVELSRLTVRQYRNAVTDLVGTFRPAGRWDEQRGLRGEYFKSRRFRNGERVLERTDPEIRFDFGTASPVPDKAPADSFSIRWQGSLMAPESGEYEFTIRTRHAARLWINDNKHPLIDAWVKSGDDTEHRASLFMLGGRVYPVRLEFSKAKQGVTDKKFEKIKPPPPDASIALEWRLPRREKEVIPARYLSPERFPELFVLTTPFPPDDRSVGYERGTSVSKAWDQASTDAAIEVAGYVAGHLAELSGAADKAADRETRLRDFCRRFAERAFRRPLTQEQKALYIDRQFEHAGNPELAVKRSVLLVLKSPRFLYHELGDSRDPYNIASRISFALWDSLPDQQLLQAAAAGKLTTPEQAARQAERLLSDVRARSKVREFLHQWLKIDPVPELAKAREAFPGFDQAAASDLRTSLDLFLEDVFWSKSSDFRQLFQADYLYLNGRLARFYGGNLPPDAPFQKLAVDPQERAGILSHPYLMATFAYTATTSPIHRGVFLSRNILGVALKPPPEAFTPLAPELHPELSTRERVALQTSPQQCQACHGVINPLGFTLEHFDAIGRYRGQERGRPINSSGAYLTRTGALVRFNGVRDLAAFLAGSADAQENFVEKLFHYLVKQPIRAFGPRQGTELQQFFAGHDCNIRKLMVEMVARSALTTQEDKQVSAGGNRIVRDSAGH
jgi:mono/diheme cytochrome c family protein